MNSSTVSSAAGTVLGGTVADGTTPEGGTAPDSIVWPPDTGIGLVSGSIGGAAPVR